MIEAKAIESHAQLGRLVGNPEHDSDCATEDGGWVDPPCTCASGRAHRAIIAILHAHRPRQLEDYERDFHAENEINYIAECMADGVMCVDSHENRETYPCPTIELIVKAIGVEP